jgi:hypothetical protein
MPKRTSTAKLDTVQNARRVVLASVGEVSAPHVVTASEAAIISRVMAEMGRKGGKIGGKRRLVTLTKARRSEIAVKAAKTRWKKAKNSKPN